MLPLKKSISIRVLTVQSSPQSLTGVDVSNPSRVYRGVRTAFWPLPCGIGMLEFTDNAVFHRLCVVDAVQADEAVQLVLCVLEVTCQQCRERILNLWEPRERVGVVRSGEAGSVAVASFGAGKSFEVDGIVNAGGRDDIPGSEGD